jgi:hypothetical protein
MAVTRRIEVVSRLESVQVAERRLDRLLVSFGVAREVHDGLRLAVDELSSGANRRDVHSSACGRPLSATTAGIGELVSST